MVIIGIFYMTVIQGHGAEMTSVKAQLPACSQGRQIFSANAYQHQPFPLFFKIS